MGQINKGKIASISGNTARVVPSDSGTKPTVRITIPANLRGILKKGTEVVYVEFSDFTGMLLGRTDGVGGSGGGASIELDTTMTQEGQAAEAKAAGDRFKTIEKQVADLLYQPTAEALPVDGIAEVGVMYFLGKITTLSVGFPATADRGDMVYLSFSTGATAPTVTFTTSNHIGIDTDFTTGCCYEVMGVWDGARWVFVVHEVTL